MNWQLATSFALIGAAVVFLSWRSWRAWRKASKGCSGGCGCAAPAQITSASDAKVVLISRDSLKLRSGN